MSAILKYCDHGSLLSQQRFIDKLINKLFDKNKNFCISAYTCSQKQENTAVTTTATATSTTNYWYNPATGACQPFSWTQTNTGNANNFPSLDMCQSYCTNSPTFILEALPLVNTCFLLIGCPRGNPQYTTSSTWYTRQWQSCSSSSSGVCSSTNFQCTNVGSNQFCCPKPSRLKFFPVITWTDSNGQVF